MAKEFSFRGKVKSVQNAITHKNLKEAIEVIQNNEAEMMLVFRSSNQKPDIYWHEDLNGVEYIKSTNRSGYIKSKTGMDGERVLMPIVKPLIDKVSNNINSKAVAKIEKELYDIIVESN